MDVGYLIHSMGFIGLLLIVSAWQLNDRKLILYCNATAFVCFAIELYFLNAYTGALMMGFASVRTLIASVTQSKRVITGLILIALVLGASQLSHWIDSLTIMASIAGIFAFFSKDVVKMRFIAVIGTSLWMVHNFYVGAWGQFTADLFILSSIAIGLYRFARGHALTS